MFKICAIHLISVGDVTVTLSCIINPLCGNANLDLGVDMQSHKQPIVDRRQEAPEKSVWWTKLSLAQKFSASSLGKFGYELCFVRNENGASIAVLTCNSGVAMITEDGDINTSPNINIR